jgi:type IV secretion system protein VirB6
MQFTGNTTFEFLYSQFTLYVIDSIKSVVSDALVAGNAPLQAALVLMLMVLGFAFFTGRASNGFLFNRLIRMLIVVTFLSVSGVYFHYVQDLFLTGIPDFLNTHLMVGVARPPGYTTTNPGGAFDVVLTEILHDSNLVLKESPSGIQGIIPGIEILVCEAVAILALTFMFAIFVLIQTLTGVVIVLGPMLILFYLFDYTKRITDGWVAALITLSILTAAIDVVIEILLFLINTIYGAIVPTGQWQTDLGSLLGGAAAILCIGFAVAVLPRVIEAVSGGVATGLGLESSHRWLRGAPLTDPLARHTARGAGRAALWTGRLAASGAGIGAQRVINRVRNRNRNRSPNGGA